MANGKKGIKAAAAVATAAFVYIPDISEGKSEKEYR